MLRPSRIDATKSAYEALHGPYDWTRFPLAPRPLIDHYHCNHYFVPKTRAYRISGSAELFPQHCQVPILLWNEHLQEVINELVTTLQETKPNKRACVLTKIIHKIETSSRDQDAQSITAPAHHWMLPDGDIQQHPYVPPAPSAEQRVDIKTQRSKGWLIR